jgi:hypothetical protein
MVSWGWLIVTTVIGVWFGFVIAVLCNAAKNNNKEN